MALTTVAITPGTGANITVDAGAGGDMQVVKLAESVAGSSSLIPGSASTGLLVNVSAVAGNVAVVNGVGTTLAVTLSGTPTIGGTVAISGTAAVTQSGTWNIGTVATITNPVTVTGTVAVSGTAAVTQSGTWNIATVATITNPVTVTGTVAISGTPTVQGTVTATQGTAAAAAGAWPVKLTDGTNSITLQSVGGVISLPVVVQAAAGASQTPWKEHVVLSASQTGVAVHTPASGKTAYVQGISVLLSGGAGLLNIYDGSNSRTTMLWASTVTWAALSQVLCPAAPIPLSAADRILKYDSGASVVGDLVVWGYDA
jgi:hypothetical protein